MFVITTIEQEYLTTTVDAISTARVAASTTAMVEQLQTQIIALLADRTTMLAEEQIM